MESNRRLEVENRNDYRRGSRGDEVGAKRCWKARRLLQSSSLLGCNSQLEQSRIQGNWEWAESLEGDQNTADLAVRITMIDFTRKVFLFWPPVLFWFFDKCGLCGQR